MTIHLPEDLEAVIGLAVDSCRYSTVDDAIRQAVQLLGGQQLRAGENFLTE
jgi:Arc/MetJ-type ribon-helix-helix transcriptional regulator